MQPSFTICERQLPYRLDGQLETFKLSPTTSQIIAQDGIEISNRMNITSAECHHWIMASIVERSFAILCATAPRGQQRNTRVNSTREKYTMNDRQRKNKKKTPAKGVKLKSTTLTSTLSRGFPSRRAARLSHVGRRLRPLTGAETLARGWRGVRSSWRAPHNCGRARPTRRSSLMTRGSK